MTVSPVRSLAGLVLCRERFAADQLRHTHYFVCRSSGMVKAARRRAARRIWGG